MGNNIALKNANFIAIDFETATTTTRAICQIGLVVVKDGEIVERISKLVCPPHNRYNSHCVEVHGITPDMTIGAPTFDVVWEEIKEHFVGNFVVAHNAPFDLSVLEVALNYYNLPLPKMMGYACTYRLTKMNLEEACQTYGIQLENHHDGACDAEACARLFLKYLNGEVDSVEETIPIYEYTPHHHKKFAGHEHIRGEMCKQDLLKASPASPFYNKQVVITGIFDVERYVLAQRLKDMGAKITQSISSRTDIVLIGEEPGPSKLEKLERLLQEGVAIEKMYKHRLKEILSIF